MADFMPHVIWERAGDTLLLRCNPMSLDKMSLDKKN